MTLNIYTAWQEAAAGFGSRGLRRARRELLLCSSSLLGSDLSNRYLPGLGGGATRAGTRGLGTDLRRVRLCFAAGKLGESEKPDVGRWQEPEDGTSARTLFAFSGC